MPSDVGPRCCINTIRFEPFCKVKMPLFQLFILIKTADDCLGRIDKSSLSQQTLFEVFLSRIPNKYKVCGSDNNEKPIQDWWGLTFSDRGEVIYVSWSYLLLKGSADLQWFPESVRKLNIEHNTLEGALDLKYLPENLEKAWLGDNEFSGLICLEKLPRKLNHIDLSSNNFEGTVCLTMLPETLRLLSLGDNSLSGCLDLTHLPKVLETLLLENNCFEGSTDFSRLPDSLKWFNIKHNDISGDFLRRAEITVNFEWTKVRIIE